MRLSDGELRWMQARLAQRYAAAGRDAQEKLERQLAVLAPDQALLTSWCYAASPLSDWANYDFSLFSSCAAPRAAFMGTVAKCSCASGAAVSQLCPPIRASMRRNSAIAEAFFTRSWQKESKAFLHVRRFLQSMPGMRSRSATARRTGEPSVRWARSAQALGRCGEESTFAVNALRAAGIPARQVYTPAGRTAMITTPGARRSATARGTISARASRSRNLTAAGLPVRPAARFWCTAAASEDPRQTIRLSRQTVR